MNEHFPFKPKQIHSSWLEFVNSSQISAVLNGIYESIRHDSFLPEEDNVLRFMHMDISRIKYIIVGMDPYPSTYDWFDVETGEHVEKPVATGRSFEIANIDSWLQKYKQTSLRNILKTIYYNTTGEEASLSEIQKSIINGTFKILPPHEWFDWMEEHGVMFLNATLTVKPNCPGSHEKHWTEFINLLVSYVESKNSKIVWVLWGNKANERLGPLVKNQIKDCHPRVNKFVKSNCFSRMGGIDWTGKERQGYS